MSSSKKYRPKKDEKLKINKNESEMKFNELKVFKRTIENNTHEVFLDAKLKSITSWRKSNSKFLKSLTLNILSLGIIHIISLYYPNLYIKLYCNPWPANECDFFLVENIYGKFTLCTKIHKKNKNKTNNNNSDISKKDIHSSSININKKLDYYFTKNLTYSFVYKSMTYEYNEITNEINPVYLDLSKMTNREIFISFGDGLTNENLVKKLTERYGKNEYYINMNLLNLYFKKVEFPSFIIVLIIGAFEFYLKDYVSFAIKYALVFGIFFFDYLIVKNLTANIYNKNYSLDSFEELKVRRKYLIDDNSEHIYAKIKNEDLLPGDIIFLKTNDVVPCDCLILDGECISSESNLTGSLEIYKKISLENNNKLFNYDLNKVNILLHGMEIISSLSRNRGYLSCLCINTGANTFKANQYSNILDLEDRKKEYQEIYNYFGGDQKYYLISSICIYFLSLLLGFLYLVIFKLRFDASNIIQFVFSVLIRTLCKSMMPMYVITNSIIILSSVFRLRNENIFCFDKSRLLNCGKVDTIFFSKTGTLCHNIFEIKSYHPAYINHHRPGIINVKNFPKNRCKEINYQLEKYYKEYFYNKQNNYNFNNTNLNLSQRHSIKMESSHNEMKHENSEYIVLFLECLLSCNNLEKLGNKIFGNIIETTIFNDMRWDIKPHNLEEEEDDKQECNLNCKINSGINTNKHDHNDHFDHNKNWLKKQFNIIHKKRSDIFPKNYFKITESILKSTKETKFQENASTSDSYYLVDQPKKSNNNDLLDTEKNSKIMSNFSNENSNNPILNDISKSYINSYIIRIYKRFICHGSFNSSSIIYNFMTKELRFMIKGIPEFILDRCDLSSLPSNFDEIISFYRKNGLVILICATKLLNIEEYSDLNTIDYYMSDLTFCGFITLKNKLKNETKIAIENLKKFDCNLIVTSGDNVNNSLSVGFDCGILENKNVFAFDKDDNDNNISIRKIYSIKNKKEEKEDENITNSSFDGVSKYNSKNSHNKPTYSPITPIIKYKYSSYIRSSRTKKIGIKKNESIMASQTIESRDLLATPKITFENHKVNQSKTSEKKKLKNYLKNSKVLFDKTNFNFHKKLDKEKTNKQTIISSTNSETNKKTEKDNKNNPRHSNVNPYSTNENAKSKSKKINKEFLEGSSNNELRNKYINYFQKFYYYPGIFQENEELKDNCIYCISGKLFRFLYNNKHKKEYQFFLEKIHKYCKIFYRMSSKDKSLSIDYYREYPNSCICKIGECQSDFDPIMTSSAGINLRAPKNINTILCHFYPLDKSLICIKKIILEGRINYENIFLLRISSIFCTMIINSYILTCFIRHIDVIIGQLNLLEISFLVLSVTAFTGKPDIIIEPEPLIRNKKLFTGHYITQILGLLFIKLVSIFLACRYYRTNRLLDPYKIDNIFSTYYFILCIELIFSTSFTINYISFYRKNILSNTFFMIFSILILIYFLMLITLNSSNLRIDIFNISYFEYFEYIIDSFDDRNRLDFFAICLFDFTISFLYSRIVYFLFDKVARSRINSNKD